MDAESLAEIRKELDRRFDEIASGQVKMISGTEVRAYFREKYAAATKSSADSQYESFHRD